MGQEQCGWLPTKSSRLPSEVRFSGIRQLLIPIEHHLLIFIPNPLSLGHVTADNGLSFKVVSFLFCDSAAHMSQRELSDTLRVCVITGFETGSYYVALAGLELRDPPFL